MKKNDNDLQTSTVDAAAFYERKRGKAEWLNEQEYYNEPEDEDEDTDADHESDYCNCSDPGCPCGGLKKGSL